MNQPLDIRGEEPSEVGCQEIQHNETLWQTAGQRQDGVHVVVGGARAQFRLGEADRDGFEIRRNDKASCTRQNTKAALVDELRADVRHISKQRQFVQALWRVGRICPCAAVVGMNGREKGNTIADDRLLIGGAEVEDVRALDFLELGECLLEFQVRRVELRLVEIVVDGFAGDRVAERDFQVDECPSKSLASVVVELSRGAFVFQIGKGHKRHLGGAFDRHVRLVGGEDLVPLSWNHIV